MVRHWPEQPCRSFPGLLLRRNAASSAWAACVACVLVATSVGAVGCAQSRKLGSTESASAEPGTGADGETDNNDRADAVEADSRSEDAPPAGEEPQDAVSTPAAEEEPAAGDKAGGMNVCVPANEQETGDDASVPPATGSSAGGNGGLDPASFPPLEADQFGAATLVADTFTLAEGPVWDPCHGQLLFSDAEARKVHKLLPDGSIDVYFQPTNYANGLAFDTSGRLLMAEMGGGKGGRITRLDRALNQEVVVDRDPACALLNTTDDLVVRSDGTLYFTDPVVAHGGYFGLSLSPKPIYRLKPGAARRTPTREGQANLPNGIRLSPDETTLYAVGYLDGKVFRFDVASDGSLSGSSTLASGLSSPDSLCVDAGGNLYVGVSAGLQVLRSDGSPVTLIPIASSRGTTNCAFGGDDGKTLFVTAWASLWRVDAVPIPGNDWARNRHMPCE